MTKSTLARRTKHAVKKKMVPLEKVEIMMDHTLAVCVVTSEMIAPHPLNITFMNDIFVGLTTCQRLVKRTLTEVEIRRVIADLRAQHFPEVTNEKA